MKIFFDTNVVIAAFAAHGICSELFEYCLTEHTICLSQKVLDELNEKLTEKFGFPKTKVKQVISFIQKNVAILTSEPLLSPICRDPDDDHILAAALSGNVDCLISGDEDLLVLKKIQGIPILKPSEFWKFEKEFRRKEAK